MTEPTINQNWWQRRSRRAKIAIVVAGLLVLLVAVTPAPEEDKPSKTTSDSERSAKDDEKPASKEADAPSPSKPARELTPIEKLERDVKKNAIDQVGKSRVKTVACTPEGRVVQCAVDYRLSGMGDGDDNEVARDVGGMLHELFRDTDVQYLYVSALTDTVDGLGKETKDDRVAWVIIRRSGWEQVNWDNLQYLEPADGIRSVSEVYADTLRN